MKLQKVFFSLALALTMVLSFVPANLLASASSGFCIDTNGDPYYYHINNGNIYVSINKETGYIQDVVNLKTGYRNKQPLSGNWPFKVKINGQPSEINYSTYNRVTTATWSFAGGDSCLQLTYDNLKDNSGNYTDVGAVVNYYIGENDDYLRFNVDFLVFGTNPLQNVWLCEGGQICSGEFESTASDTMVAPLWGEGVYWKDPAAAFTGTDTSNPHKLLYPGNGWGDLEMGWIDISGLHGGIGIAYIDKQQMQMEFDVSRDGNRMAITPALLHSRIQDRTIPIGTGGFSTDMVIIAPHTGDWHRMADIYRTEYQKAFTVNNQPDYLTYGDLSPQAKDIDVFLRYLLDNAGSSALPTFDAISGNALSTINNWAASYGFDPGNVAVWISGQNEKGYSHDVPSMLPANTAAGGLTRAVSLANDIHNLGASLIYYQHPFAFATDSADYAAVSSTNPNPLYFAPWDDVDHHYVCVDNSLIYGLWQNKIIPEAQAFYQDGMMFDQGSLQCTVCLIAGHNHGLDAVSAFSSHSKGMVALSKLVRETLNENETSYIMSEGFSDLTARYIDILQARWDMEVPPDRGGKLLLGVRQYTFPQYINMYSSAENCLNPKNRRQLVAIMGGVCCLNEGEDWSSIGAEEYLWLKKELREEQAPGYPYNYRDNIGLFVSDKNLYAKVFTDGDLATITCWATKTVSDVTISFDPAELGLPGVKKTFTFDLQAERVGYIIYNAATGTVQSSSVALKSPAVYDSAAVYFTDLVAQGSSYWQGNGVGTSNTVFDVPPVVGATNVVVGSPSLVMKDNLCIAATKSKFSNMDLLLNINADFDIDQGQWGWFVMFRDSPLATGIGAIWSSDIVNKDRYFIQSINATQIALGKQQNDVVDWLGAAATVVNMAGRDVPLRIVCEDQPNGSVNIIVYADGNQIISYNDSTNPITEKGYITLVYSDTASSAVTFSGQSNPVPAIYVSDYIALGTSAWIGTGIGTDATVDNYNSRKMNLCNNICAVAPNALMGCADIHATMKTDWSGGSQNWGWMILFRDSHGYGAPWSSDVPGKTRYILSADNSTSIRLGKQVQDTVDWLPYAAAVPDMTGRDVDLRIITRNTYDAVEITIVVDGKAAISYTDTNDPIKAAGYTTFINDIPGCTTLTVGSIK